MGYSTEPNKPYWYKAMVVKIIDGDTIDLLIDLGFNLMLNQRIRLLGINTPEIDAKELAVKERGLVAKKRVSELLPVGRWVMVETTKDKKDKYGRILGVIFPGTVDSQPITKSVNDILLEEKLAEPMGG